METTTSSRAVELGNIALWKKLNIYLLYIYLTTCWCVAWCVAWWDQRKVQCYVITRVCCTILFLSSRGFTYSLASSTRLFMIQSVPIIILVICQVCWWPNCISHRKWMTPWLEECHHMISHVTSPRCTSLGMLECHHMIQSCDLSMVRFTRYAGMSSHDPVMWPLQGILGSYSSLSVTLTNTYFTIPQVYIHNWQRWIHGTLFIFMISHITSMYV